jgi:hypothetical protein
MLSAWSYGVGAAELLAIVLGAVAGGAATRRRLLPGWSGPPAWIATAVLALMLVLAVAEVLGVIALFKDLPLVLCIVALGVALHLRLRPGPPDSAATPPAPEVGPRLKLAGIAIAAVAIAHFTVGVRLRLSTGMTGFDSTWYHGPFAALFAQTGRTFDVRFIAPQFLAWFYPQNSELLHGVGVVAFGRDLLSPLLNLGWLTGCLLAAWCIGRPYGAGPVSLAGVAVALDTGAFADQAGEARNDIVALFFVLAALAIALNAAAARPQDRRLPSGALAIAGLAAGLAAGTKVNFLAPAAAILIGLAVQAPRGERRRALVAAGLPALAGAGFWYLRNLVHAGSPLPWVKHIGPIALPSPDQAIGGREGHSVLGYLTDSSVWSDWFLPGLHQGFGVGWPVLVLLAAAGLALSVTRSAEVMLRVCGGTGIVLLAVWLLGPTSASGPDGAPRGFVSGLRYLVPALAVGLSLLPLAPRLRSPSGRWAVLLALAILLPFTDASATPWYSGYLAAAVAVGVVAATLPLALGSPRLRSLPRGALAVAAVVVLALAVAAGERGQRSYLRNRYADPHFSVAGLDAAFRWARNLSDVRIATTGTRQYPLFGTELSNRVQFVGVHRANAGFVRPRSCPAWRRAVNAGDYDYLVVTRDRFEPRKPPFPPQVGWTLGDPAASVVLRRAPAVVFRLRGPLDRLGCTN